ncbi:MAG TPA: ribonuclease D [Alphaproteobacteria bacterium]|nr:ribonuclease D [Alphaproteobacteria bacterium]
MVRHPSSEPLLITETDALAAFCERLEGVPFITIDTEFLREKTYWPILCLIQIAGPEPDQVAAIDSLAPGIDLSPLFPLLKSPKTVKVFHAARQDVEIFFRLTGSVPKPIVDTQVLAMVCGFGDAASYETLAGKLANTRLDKLARFTDWSRRPLSARQLDYALSDVTHLRLIYEKLHAKAEKTERLDWIAEEMALLTDPATYEFNPENAWKRLKTRSEKPRFLAVLKEVAAWREREAQNRDVPRNRVLNDENIVEIAAHVPETAEALAQSRGLSRGFADGRNGEAILAAVRRGLAVPEDEAPKLPPRPDIPPGLGPLIDLLRVLLKHRCDEFDVAQKLVANAADLERIAADDHAKVQALHGWRRKLFGEEALALKHGKLALTAKGRSIRVISLE